MLLKKIMTVSLVTFLHLSSVGAMQETSIKSNCKRVSHVKHSKNYIAYDCNRLNPYPIEVRLSSDEQAMSVAPFYPNNFLGVQGTNFTLADKEFKGHSGRINYVIVITGEVINLGQKAVTNILISGSEDQTVRVWDIATGECLAILKGHSQPVVRLDYLGDSYVSSTSQDGEMICWDLVTLKPYDPYKNDQPELNRVDISGYC